MPTWNMESSRVMLFDLETTNLKADFGYLLAVGYKFLGEKKPTVLSIKHTNGVTKFRSAEKALVKAFREVYLSADVIVTYNGKRFDVPYLNAKMLEYDLGILPNLPHVDHYWTVKNNLGISRKSLQNAAYYLKLSAEKTPVEGRIWVDAMMGDRKALKYIVDHCAADVDILEELHYKIRGLVRMHPRVNGYGPCKYCGERRLQRRGPAVTTAKRTQYRFQCMACGGWDTRAESAA